MIKEIVRSYYPILFRILQVMLLVCVMLEVCGSILGIYDTGIPHWLIAMLCIGLFSVILYGKARERLICGIVLAGSFLVVLFFIGSEQIGVFWTSYFDWLVGNEGWNTEWMTGYALIQTVVVTFCCYLFQMLGEKYRILRDASVIAILAGLIVSMIYQREISQAGVALTIGYAAICYTEKTQSFWEKRKEHDTREYVIRLIPFCAFYIVLMCLMPAPEEPYDWRFVKEAYRSLKEDFTIWVEDRNRKGQEDFGAELACFTEDGRLMSDLIDHNQELITVKGGYGLETDIYLIGKIYDTFDGRQWTQTNTEETKERLMDTLETLYAVERFDSKNQDVYLYSTGLSLRYEHFDTGYVFAPLKLRYLEDCDYQTSGGNLIFGEQKGYGTSYRANYFQLNQARPEFYDMTEAKLADDEDIWNEVVQNYMPREEKKASLEDLKQYQSNTKKMYLKETPISQETEEYLSEITADADTTLQKLGAIEQALATLTYTKTPGKLPEDIRSQEDFLDYFLLESKQGYCSYYATAFVLLARAEGLPARYVQGFCVPVDADKEMTVTANMAHAWPEVYLEGIGWLPFEPTPGYGGFRYSTWERKGVKNYNINQNMKPEKPEIEETEEEKVIDEVQKEKNRQYMMMLFSGLAIVLVACILVFFMDQSLFRRRYERMTVKDKFLVEVRKNLWLLSKLGYTRDATETLEELQNRLKAGLPHFFVSRKEFAFMRGYEEFLYRSDEVQEEVLQVSRAEREEILQWIKADKRWFYYTLSVRLKFVR